MSVSKIKSALKKKNIVVDSIYCGTCAYGGGWVYFISIGDVEGDILDANPDCDIETQFDSWQHAVKWVEQLPTLSIECE